jgi:hypothetical protein
MHTEKVSVVGHPMANSNNRFQNEGLMAPCTLAPSLPDAPPTLSLSPMSI